MSFEVTERNEGIHALAHSILSATIVSDGIVIEFQDHSHIYFPAETLAAQIGKGSSHRFLTNDPSEIADDQSTETVLRSPDNQSDSYQKMHTGELVDNENLDSRREDCAVADVMAP